MEFVRGQLLVATPIIDAGVFRRSVIYVLDHDDSGALGVVVNHPLTSDVADILPDWVPSVNAPASVFEGGPVATDSALAVGVVRDANQTTGWQQVIGRIGLVDLEGPAPEPGTFIGIRVFAGYAGWSPGQLEEEISEGSWVVVDAEDEDLLSASPDRLWHKVLRRQESDIRFMSTYPSDPEMN